MEFRGMMGGLYRICEWIMRLSVINVLWVICSLPFFYLLLVVVATPDMTMDMFKQSLLMLGVISPFTLVPATSAMFAVARKWVMGDEDVPLLKTYFRSYKENYLQSMLGGLSFLLIAVILFVNYRFYSTQSGSLHWLSLLFLTFSIVVGAAFINFISIMVHFHMKFFQLLKNSFIVTLGQPFMAIALLATNGVIVYFSVRYTFLVPFFMGSLCAVASFWYFYRSFQRIQMKVEAARQQSAEQASGEENGDRQPDDPKAAAERRE